MEAGLDSIGAVELRNSVSSKYGVDLPATITFDQPTVRALADYLAAMLAPQRRTQMRTDVGTFELVQYGHESLSKIFLHDARSQSRHSTAPGPQQRCACSENRPIMCVALSRQICIPCAAQGITSRAALAHIDPDMCTCLTLALRSVDAFTGGARSRRACYYRGGGHGQHDGILIPAIPRHAFLSHASQLWQVCPLYIAPYTWISCSESFPGFLQFSCSAIRLLGALVQSRLRTHAVPSM